MINTIDKFLSRITMYRVVLYYLVFLFAVAVVFGFLGILPFSGISIILSTLFILAVCLVTNYIFAWAFNAQINLESAYITALILVFIELVYIKFRGEI